MTEDIEKQKRIVAEAMETAKIVQDTESRINLSLQLLKLNELEPIPEDELMRIRKECRLTSAVWFLVEYKIMNEE